jgi:hypothetical protein
MNVFNSKMNVVPKNIENTVSRSSGKAEKIEQIAGQKR